VRITITVGILPLIRTSVNTQNPFFSNFLKDS
jgi:hypothetical protein